MASPETVRRRGQQKAPSLRGPRPCCRPKSPMPESLPSATMPTWQTGGAWCLRTELGITPGICWPPLQLIGRMITLWAAPTGITLESNSWQQNDRPLIFVCHSLGGLVCEDVSYPAISKRNPNPNWYRLCQRHSSGLKDISRKSSTVLAGSYSWVLHTMAPVLRYGRKDSPNPSACSSKQTHRF